MPDPPGPGPAAEAQPESQVLQSCWIIEAARHLVLESFGYSRSAAAAAERAGVLARCCGETRPDLARAHAAWMAEVAGAPSETGGLGWFLLQRLGSYVDAHAAPLLTREDLSRLRELGAADAMQVSKAFGRGGMPAAPPPEWPSVPRAQAPGLVHTRFGIIGDPHVGIGLSDRLTRAAVDDLNREGVAFSVALGDLTHGGGIDLFLQARQLLDGLQAPLLATIGNHDIWDAQADRPLGRQHFTAAFGRKTYGIHEGGEVRAVLLDSADPTPSRVPPFDMLVGSFTDEPNGAVPGGRISQQVGEWSEAIGAGGPSFIALHHPPYPYLGFPPLTFGLDEPSTDRLTRLARRIDAWGIFCGHTHRCALSELAGIPVLEVPSVKDWPYAYGLVEVSDRGWACNLRPISDTELVKEASTGAPVSLRRYARGPAEARAFARRR